MVTMEKKVAELESKVRKLLNERRPESEVSQCNCPKPVYASLTEPDDISNTGSYNAWTFGHELSNGVNISSSSKMTILEPGDYLININMALQSSGNVTTVSLHFNGVADTGEYYQLPDYNFGQLYVFAISMSGIRSLKAGDDLELKVSASSGTTYGAGGGFTILKVN